MMQKSVNMNESDGHRMVGVAVWRSQLTVFGHAKIPTSYTQVKYTYWCYSFSSKPIVGDHFVARDFLHNHIPPGRKWPDCIPNGTCAHADL